VKRSALLQHLRRSGCYLKPDGHPVVVGMLTRYNRRTVTVITDSGQRWNVAPALLQRAESPDAAQDPGPNVIRLPRK
jgi:hypothetical protein